MYNFKSVYAQLSTTSFPVVVNRLLTINAVMRRRKTPLVKWDFQDEPVDMDCFTVSKYLALGYSLGYFKRTLVGKMYHYIPAYDNQQREAMDLLRYLYEKKREAVNEVANVHPA